MNHSDFYICFSLFPSAFAATLSAKHLATSSGKPVRYNIAPIVEIITINKYYKSESHTLFPANIYYKSNHTLFTAIIYYKSESQTLFTSNIYYKSDSQTLFSANIYYK